MTNSDSRDFSSYILPVIAIFLGTNMSIFFSQISVSNDAYSIPEDLGYLSVIIAIIFSYFFIFYTIYKIGDEKSISIWIFGGVLFASMLIILIGIHNIKGILVKIMLWLLIATLFITLWKAGFREARDWYLIILFPLVFSTIFSMYYSSDLEIEDEDIWLKSEDNKNGLIRATLFIELEAKRYDANNIRAKIICTNQILLDPDECTLLGIDTLKKDEKRLIKWHITFREKNSHSFYLYLVNSGGVSNKRITIYPGNDQWEAEIDDVKYLENFVIFLKHNPFLSLF